MNARRLARSSLVVVLGAALGSPIAACRPKPEAGPTAPLVQAPPQPRPPVEAPPPKPVAVATAPVQLLPEGTGVTLTVASVQHLLRVVDYPALIAKYRPQYDQVAAAVVQSTGHNLLDPVKWREIGVDPDGPIGFAVFDVEAGAGCAYFTLADATRFRDFVDQTGAKLGGRIFPVFEDRGVVLASEAGASTALVLRDGFAFFVFVDRPDKAPYDYARELASVDPARALAASARWQKAVGAAAPRDLLAFVDVAGMLRASIEARRKSAENPEPTWAELELQRLREQGAPAEEIARWEQTAAEQKQFEAQLRERRLREQEVSQSIFGPLGPWVVELSLTDKAVQGTVRVQAPETALVRKIVVPRDAPPLALTAAGQRVLFGGGGSFDEAELVRVLAAMAKASGEDLERVFAEIQRDLGVDPRGVLAALDGTGSFALTIKDPAALATDKGTQALGFTLALGLKEPEKIQGLLDAVAAKLPPPLKARKDAKARRYSVKVPDWNEVHVAVVGARLAVSTDVNFLAAVERGSPGPGKGLPAATVPVVTAREAVGVLFMDYVAPMGLFVARSSSSYRYDPATNQPYWRFPEVAQEKIDKVAQSAAYKAKLKEWRALDDKVRKAEEARERAQTKVILAVAESVGSLAVNLRETAEGLQAEGGQYFGPGGLARAIELGVDAISTRGGGDDPVWELYDRRSKVEQEMTEIRVRDVEKALGVQAPRQ